MSSQIADTPIKTEKMKHDAISHGLTADDIKLNCLHHLGERPAPRLLEGEEPQGMLKLYGMMNEMNHTTSAMEKMVIQLKTMTQQVIFSVAEQQLCMDLNEAEQWVWAMEKIAVQIRTMTQTICQTGTGDQHSQHGELVPHSENCIADSLAHQYNHSIASDAAVDLIDSCQTCRHQTTGTGNKKIDFKYDLLVCKTSPSPASHKIIKKTVATGLVHHISEVIKLSLAFKTQLIFLRPDTPNHRNNIGSSLRHNDYVQCRHCSNFERDRPNLGSESPTSTVPMKLYHGSATCVNTPGLSKSSECRHPSTLIDYTEGQALISAATLPHKWQPPEYPTRMVGDSRPSMLPTNDYHQGTQGMGGRVGDSRPPGQPPDLHEEGMVTLPIGIAPISRDSPEGHVKTTQAGDRRPPGQPPDLHEEGMVTLPIGIAPISRDSPEGHVNVKTTQAGDRRPPGQPPDLHEEGMVTLPIGIAPISRASPEGDKTPDNYYKWTSQLLDYTRVMGDGRPPGEPPDHEGTSHMMDYFRVMGDGRTPGEPPDHCHKGTSQPLDHNTIWGLYLPFYRASSAFLWIVPVLMARRHRLVDFYRASSAFLWTVPVLMARRHHLVDFYRVSSAFLWIVPVVLARRHRLVDFYRALPQRPSNEYQADASLTLLKGTTGNDSTQRISEYWNENYQHVIVRPTGHLSN